MDRLTNTKFPPNLVLTAVLSGGITLGLSMVYILLSIAFLVFRTNCSAGSTASTTGAEYFWQTIFRVYVLRDTCEQKIEIERLVDESTVLILTSITLGVSVVCLLTSITLITIMQDEGQSRYVKLVVYSYIGSCVVSLVVDLTTATFFGIDYSYLTSLLRQLSAGSSANYRTEVIRQGAFLFMTIALKGYVVHIINGVLLGLLVAYVLEYQSKTNKSDEHSIHKLGALNAFDQRRKLDEPWSQRDLFNNSPFSRGPQINNAFVDESPPHSPRRPDPAQFDYVSNRSFDRSDSWSRPQNAASQSSRPFSYLEDIKRPVAARPTPSPAVESQWRRDPWAHTPPLPAPDYSPNQPRRLKSALKPAY